MESPATSPHRRSGVRYCCVGCAGVVATGLAVFLVVFTTAGTYHPKLSPAPPAPFPNAVDDYILAGRLYAQTGGDATLSNLGPNVNLKAKQTVVRSGQPALAVLRGGLSKECGVPFGPVPAAGFPYLADIRALARLLKAESDTEAAAGHWSASARASLDAIELGTDIQRGGSVYHVLVGSACQAIGQANAARSIEHLDTRECGEFAKRLQRIIRERIPAAEAVENPSDGFFPS